MVAISDRSFSATEWYRLRRWVAQMRASAVVWWPAARKVRIYEVGMLVSSFAFHFLLFLSLRSRRFVSKE